MKNKRVRTTSVVMGVIMVNTLAGCGTTAARTNSSKPNHTVVIALPLQVSPNWFFPVISSADYGDANFEMNTMMYVPPCAYFTNGQYQLSPLFGLKHTHLNKNSTISTIHLNPKYRWSNGQPVTARDVVFTWNILKATSTGASNLPWGYGQAGSGGIPRRWSTVVAKGLHTVVVTLKYSIQSRVVRSQRSRPIDIMRRRMVPFFSQRILQHRDWPIAFDDQALPLSVFFDSGHPPIFSILLPCCPNPASNHAETEWVSPRHQCGVWGLLHLANDRVFKFGRIGVGVLITTFFIEW